jgi:hypothetical protein
MAKWRIKAKMAKNNRESENNREIEEENVNGVMGDGSGGVAA